MLDLKFVNGFFSFPKVKFENLAVLKNAHKDSAYATSIDISDAYHHLRVHEEL